MSSWVISIGDQFGFGLSADFTRFMGIAGIIQSRTTESHVQHRIRHTCRLENLLVRVSSNTHDGLDTFRVRVNGGDGNLTIAVPAMATGVFEDTANTQSLSDGDLVDTRIVSGGASGTLDLNLISYVLTDPVGNRSYVMGGSDGTFGAVFGSTLFGHLGGDIIHGETVEAETQYRLRFSTTLDRFRVVVATNTIDGASTFRTRVNGANGNQTFTVPSLATGEFEDTTNSDITSSGDLVNYQLVTGGTVGSMVVSHTQIRMDAVGRITTCGFDSGTTSFSPATGSRFVAIESAFESSSAAPESDVRLKARIRFDARNYRVFVVSNDADAAANISLRVNGATSVLAVNIPTLATGEFEDTADTIQVQETDEVNHFIDVSLLTSGAIGLKHIGFQQDAVVTVAPPLPEGLQATAPAMVLRARRG